MNRAKPIITATMAFAVFASWPMRALAQAFHPGQTFYSGPSVGIESEETSSDTAMDPASIKDGEMVFLLHGIGKF